MSSQSLSVQLGPLTLRHPLINASGTFDLFDLADIAGPWVLDSPPVAAYVPKTVTLYPREGNPPPRIAESVGGLLNSIGLPNEGVESFCRNMLPRLHSLPCPVILNIAGFAPFEYRLVAERLVEGLKVTYGKDPACWASRVGIELNVSCPNVHSGCMAIGSDPAETGSVVAEVRKVWPRPLLLIVKLTPNVTDMTLIARAAEAAGASAVSLVNTFKGMVLDRATLRPWLGGVTGGLSGPAIKPLALRFVYEVSQVVDIPVVGMGGVYSVQDVLDFMACGAQVVAVGSAGLVDPLLPSRLARELEEELAARSLTLGELVGRAYRNA